MSPVPDGITQSSGHQLPLIVQVIAFRHYTTCTKSQTKRKSANTSMQTRSKSAAAPACHEEKVCVSHLPGALFYVLI